MGNTSSKSRNVTKRILPPPDELRRLYIGEGKSGIEIAKEFGCSSHAVYGELSRHGISKGRTAHWLNSKRPKTPSRGALKLLNEQGFTVGEIARVFDVHSRTASKWMNEYGIKGTHRKPAQIIKKDLLKILYEEKLFSVAEIADILSLGPGVVVANMKRHRIKKRGAGRTKGVSARRIFK